MPLKQCSNNGKSGWKYGDNGRCYTGPGAKQKAIKQGLMISHKTGEEFHAMLMYTYIDDHELDDCLIDSDIITRAVAYISQKTRNSIPKEDFGDPEMRKYPVRNQSDLDAAVKLVGRAPRNRQAMIRSNLKNIAQRKGLSLPDSWKNA